MKRNEHAFLGVDDTLSTGAVCYQFGYHSPVSSEKGRGAIPDGWRKASAISTELIASPAMAGKMLL